MAGKSCEWTTRKSAFQNFVASKATQSQSHIKPIHWYVAGRLVLEGGFLPEEITPRPPFVAVRTNQAWHLSYDESVAGSGELNVLGGLKTKQVDVTVCKDGIGPVVAVSMKGSLRAFRNLTNRMEEAVGDCTNLHLSYPALVYGFLHVVKANREGFKGVQDNDVAIRTDGTIVESLQRYGEVLRRLAGRDDVRDVATKYESVCLALVEAMPGVSLGQVLDQFPAKDSELHIDSFFERIYAQYDQRFVYAAPAIQTKTSRIEWKLSEDILEDTRFLDFEARQL